MPFQNTFSPILPNLLSALYWALLSMSSREDMNEKVLKWPYLQERRKVGLASGSVIYAKRTRKYWKTKESTYLWLERTHFERELHLFLVGPRVAPLLYRFTWELDGVWAKYSLVTFWRVRVETKCVAELHQACRWLTSRLRTCRPISYAAMKNVYHQRSGKIFYRVILHFILPVLGKWFRICWRHSYTTSLTWPLCRCRILDTLYSFKEYGLVGL